MSATPRKLAMLAMALSLDISVVAFNFHPTVPNVSYAYLTSSAVFAADQILPLKSHLIDPAGNYNASTNTFTAPFTCYVKVEFSCSLYASGTVSFYGFV